MKEITEYEVVKSQSVHRLRDNVKRLIGEGWQPFGGISSSPTTYIDENYENSDTVMFSQAMVKYAKA